MRRITVVSALLTCAMFGPGIDGCFALPLMPPRAELHAAHLRFKQPTAVPRGYYELCKAGSPVCGTTRARGVEANADGQVVLTSSLIQALRTANSTVNHQMQSRPDGAQDSWSVGGGSGDCEDFALTKKMRLMQAGFPSKALLIALARTPSGENHAVLIVRTDQGDFALDNLTDSLKGWDQTGLRWTMVQSPSSEWSWFAL